GNFGSDWRRHGITDHSKPLDLRSFEGEIIRKSLNACGLADREATVLVGVQKISWLAEFCIHRRRRCVPFEAAIFTIEGMRQIDLTIDTSEISSLKEASGSIDGHLFSERRLLPRAAR